MNIGYRSLNALLVVMAIVVSVFVIAYLQNHLFLDPCPLCIFQRIGLWILGLFAFLAALFNPKSKLLRLLFWIGGMTGTLWGLGVAARHTWIHYFPSMQMVECGAGLNHMMDTMPMSDVFSNVLSAPGDCTIIDWTVLGLSIPAQAVIMFIFALVIQGFILKKILKNQP